MIAVYRSAKHTQFSSDKHFDHSVREYFSDMCYDLVSNSSDVALHT